MTTRDSDAMTVDGAHISVRRDRRARRLKLRVDRATGAASVTAPPDAGQAVLERFVRANLEWLRAHQAAAPGPQPFEIGAEIPVRGAPTRIELCGQALRPEWVPGAIRLPILAGRCPERVSAETEALLRRLCRDDLTAVCARHARNLGRPHGRITLRDPRSRWGSCASNGNLSFSWRLILAPSFVLNYLAAHEVAHLAHMDHSPQFWATAARLDPEYKTAEKWLKTHGPRLRSYGLTPCTG